MLNIHDVADYIIVRTDEAGLKLTIPFLQKLLYYCQAWNLGLNHKPLFNGKFIAGVFGPVNYQIYDRFDGGLKWPDTIIFLSNIRKEFDFEIIPENSRTLINEVLEEYGRFSDSQLTVRSEKPWQKARKEYGPAGKCKVEIDEELMRKQFSDSMLSNDQIDFYMRRDQPDLYSALIKCAEDIDNKGVQIFHGWRICDLLKEAALNLKELKE